MRSAIDQSVCEAVLAGDSLGVRPEKIVVTTEATLVVTGEAGVEIKVVSVSGSVERGTTQSVEVEFSGDSIPSVQTCRDRATSPAEAVMYVDTESMELSPPP